jgi:hypothetical protein
MVSASLADTNNELPADTQGPFSSSVLDLTTLGYALRMRWEWQARTSPDKPWASLPTSPERAMQAMFDASVTVEVGNGRRALLWQDRWIHESLDPLPSGGERQRETVIREWRYSLCCQTRTTGYCLGSTVENQCSMCTEYTVHRVCTDQSEPLILDQTVKRKA